MLNLHTLTKTFPDGLVALKDIDLTIRENEVVSIVGPSGCGKSTLLKIIAGLDAEYGGALTRRQRTDGSPSIGLIFQEPRLMPWLTVVDNAAFGLRAPGHRRREVAMAWLRRVGLADFADALPRALSGGMAQRVSIARALAPGPDVLLLDEPFSAVDAFTKLDLQDLMLEIWAELRTTTVLVTHDVEEAIYLSDRVVVLSGRPGRIVAVFDVAVPRPRRRDDADLVRLREEVLASLGLHRRCAEAA